MRIDGRVSVTGEMLAAGNDTRPLQPVRDGNTETGDGARMRSERTVADHRVLRIRRDVEHWREVDVDSDAPQLLAHRDPLPIREVRRARLAHDRRRRELREGLTEPQDAATLVVDGDEDRAIFRGDRM